MKRIYLMFLALVAAMTAKADNFDFIKSSPDYYIGLGTAETETEADRAAFADLSNNIAAVVQSQFTGIDDVKTTNGNVEHTQRVSNIVNVCSQACVTDCKKLTQKSKGMITVLRYISKDQLNNIFAQRIEKAQSMIREAANYLAKGKIDMALEYYYWGYSLIRSVMNPNSVKDDEGRLLMTWVPQQIDDILDDITIEYEGQEDEWVDLLFNYKGTPVRSLQFSYNDGQTHCHGNEAKNGRGTLEMHRGYQTDIFHVNIEYQFVGQARGDHEMECVLASITPKVFKGSERKVKRTANPFSRGNQNTGSKPAQNTALATSTTKPTTLPESLRESEANVSAAREELVATRNEYADIDAKMSNIVAAIKKHNYTDYRSYFTADGREMYERLLQYGTARVVGVPDEYEFYRSTQGKIVVRGLQMSFSFSRGTKKTFVEDVVFTFNADGLVEAVTFGLGKTAIDDILRQKGADLAAGNLETVIEFMENYKTAYAMKDLDYLNAVFAEDAVIISGRVVKRNVNRSSNINLSQRGREIVEYTEYTKQDYIKHLAEVFQRNPMINLRFTNNEVQWLPKFKDRNLFAIEINQEYNSTRYADIGYLFLLVDTTNPEEPLIEIRTWQPEQVGVEERYKIGDFTNQ